jgi:hypothetical protein
LAKSTGTTVTEAPAAAGSPKSLLWAVIGLIAVLEAFLLYRAFHIADFAKIIPWDDCSILDLALLRLSRAGHAGSLLGLVKMAQDLAPHSPIADYQAMLGYLFSGGGAWGPYALNALPLALGLMLAWPALARRTPIVLAPILLALSFHPLTIYSLTNLKSDWKAGFLAALAIYVFVQAVRSMARRDWLIASGLMGAAVVCKLTAFYIPPLALMMLGYFEFVAALANALAAPQRRGPVAAVIDALGRMIGRWREIALEALLVAGPYGLFFLYGSHSHFNTIRYIKGALSSTWIDGLTTLGRAGVYAPPANPAWGPLAWLLPLSAVLAVFIALRFRRLALWQPLLLGVPAMALFLAPLVFGKTSNIEFSGLFVGVALGTALALASDVATQGRRWTAVMAVVLLASCGLSTFTSYRPPLTEAQLRDQDHAVEVYEAIANQVIALRREPDTTIDFYYEDSVYPQSNLALKYFAKTGRRLDITRIDLLPGMPDAPSAAEPGDFTLVASPDPGVVTVGYAPSRFLWATKNSGPAHAYVTRLPNMALVQAFPWKGGHIELYRRIDRTNPPPPAAQP